jgi:hypothetical protein
MRTTSLASDNEKFQVDKEVADRRMLIKNMIEGQCTKSDHQPLLFPSVLAIFAS